jgi:hypothetical protein
MVLQQTYTFTPADYNCEGINCHDRSFFLQTIKDWELDFHRKHPHCFADHLFANNNTMKLIHNSLGLDSTQECGMELIDGEVNMEAHMEMETYSSVQTIYALGSEIPENLEEPLLLIIDHNLPDGAVQLKYIPENDQEAEDVPRDTGEVREEGRCPTTYC